MVNKNIPIRIYLVYRPFHYYKHQSLSPCSRVVPLTPHLRYSFLIRPYLFHLVGKQQMLFGISLTQPSIFCLVNVSPHTKKALRVCPWVNFLYRLQKGFFLARGIPFRQHNVPQDVSASYRLASLTNVTLAHCRRLYFHIFIYYFFPIWTR